MTSAILIPFKGESAVIESCLRTLLPLTPKETRVVVIVDGGKRPNLADHPEVTLLSHEQTKGPAAARNTGIEWCMKHDIALVILLDADCSALPGMVEAHRALHEKYPGVFCIGGAIRGSGAGPWAYLDRVMSWFTSMEHLPERVVEPPLHLPTTNMSLKLNARVRPLAVFDEQLKTGEDVAFVGRLRAAEEQLLFSPEPKVIHHDRTTFQSFVRHQVRWGLHTYVVRFGPSGLALWKRALFIVGFLPLIPFFAGYATWLNMRPWLSGFPGDFYLVPAVFIAYLVKAFAIVRGAQSPSVALFPAGRVV